jgi:hypothetical protein
MSAMVYKQRERQGTHGKEVKKRAYGMGILPQVIVLGIIGDGESSEKMLKDLYENKKPSCAR